MKTKEEVIKEAWGGAYGGDMIENGWKPINSVFISDTLRVDYSECKKYVRPKTLQGIEDNNGWIAIKSEEDLPKEEGKYLTHRKNGIIIEEYFYLKNPFAWQKYYNVTHYQQITKPKPPLHD